MFKHLLMLTALMLPVSHANADDVRVTHLNIANPWSMELPPNAPTVAAYFIIHNEGKTADRLLRVDTPVAGSAQLHEHVHANGLMKMQPVTSVEVPAGGDAVFAPMGYHVMLLDLKDKSALVQGQSFPLILHFEKAGDITVQVNILKQPPASTPHAH
jgi:copper(I)-binding protein